MYDYLVYIGRFQPFHNGHLDTVRYALKNTRRLMILIGSSNRARSPKNPFTFEERRKMILDSIPEHIGRVDILPLEDVAYNDDNWITTVQKIVNAKIVENENPNKNTTLHGVNDFKVGIVGFSKDSSSYYLKLFPNWKLEEIPGNLQTLNSTDIRNIYLKSLWTIPGDDVLPKGTSRFLQEFKHKPEFKWLVTEKRTNEDYNPRVYDNDIVSCVDAVVIQSGNILLVERKFHPGQGLLALPGGHVNKNERFLDAVVRELKEETRISDEKGEIPPAMLTSFIKSSKLFDDPNRSERARVITQAYLFKLPNREKLFTVKGSDDAATAKWYRIGDLEPHMFFEDHYFIINSMINQQVE